MSVCLKINLHPFTKPVRAKLLLLLVFFWSYSLQAQNSPFQAGTAFSTIPMDYGQHPQTYNEILPGGDTLDNKLFVLATNAACVRVRAYYTAFDTTFFLAQDSLSIITLPLKNNQHPYYQAITNTITVNATRPISLIQGVGIGRDTLYPEFGAGRRSAITRAIEATSIIPNKLFIDAPLQHPFINESSALARDFPPYQLGRRMPLIIQSLADQNDLLFITGISLGLNNNFNNPIYTAGDSIFVTLNQFETIYYSRLEAFFEQNNRSLIKTLNSKPFKTYITSTAHTYNFPTGNSEFIIGYVFEDQKPKNTLDQAYHVPPTEGNVGNQYALIATGDSTIINRNGQFFLRLDSLERFDTCLAGPQHFTSAKNFFVSITPCNERGLGNGKPYMVYPPGDSDLMQESLFTTLNEPTFDNDYRLAVSLPTAGVGTFSLNGQVVPTNLFSTFPADPTWSYANIALDSSIYKALCPIGFNAFQYTWFKDSASPGAQYPSYGYNLSESILWPADSFKLRIGSRQNVLDTMSNQPLVYCVGDTFYLSPPKDRYTTWQWTIGDSTFSQKSVAQAAGAIAYSINEPGFYPIMVSDSLGCGSYDSASVEIVAQPSPDFEYNLELTCTEAQLVLENTSLNANRYTWYWLDDSTTTASPTLNLDLKSLDSSLQIELRTENENCSSRVVKMIPLNQAASEMNIPNVLTPNNDGQNDSWCFENMLGFPECFSIEIANRWGQVVFKRPTLRSAGPQKPLQRGFISTPCVTVMSAKMGLLLFLPVLRRLFFA
jgi:hypothetical protein